MLQKHSRVVMRLLPHDLGVKGDMDRIMGLDIGDRTIGIAISDPFYLTAQGLETIRRTDKKTDIVKLQQIIQEKEIIRIIVGLPKNMNNTIGPQAKKVKTFVKALQKEVDIEILYQDERLTTVSAEKLLIEGNVRREKRKKIIDRVAATYILQTYLDQEKLYGKD